MTPPITEPVVRLFAPLAGADLVPLFADQDASATIAREAEELMDPAAEVVFIGVDGVVLDGLRGFEGLLAGWHEWLTPFSAYRFELDGIEEHGDRVAVLVRQTGTTVHGGVDVPSSPSAAIYTVRDGRIVRAAFYLDRAHAARSEGLDLPG